MIVGQELCSQIKGKVFPAQPVSWWGEMAPGQTKESFMKGLIKGGVGKVMKNQQGDGKVFGG